jgi:RNA recognition motif-containing protein
VNIYVGNLPSELTEQELQLEFETFGKVDHVMIVNDGGRGGQSSGHGFVEMASKLDGAAAIAGLVGKRLKSRPIDVIEALPLSDRASRTPRTKRQPAGPQPEAGRSPGRTGEQEEFAKRGKDSPGTFQALHR